MMWNLHLFALKHKSALRIAVPAILTADAAHNAYIMYRLYIERLQVGLFLDIP